MRHFLTFAVVCLATAFFVSPAQSDDFSSPGFRYDPLSYTAYWEFLNVVYGEDIPPELIEFTGYGNYELWGAWTHAHINHDIVFWDQDGQFLYTDAIPGEIDFFLNNWEDDMPYKHIWVQVHYSCQGDSPHVSSVLGAYVSSDWADPFVGERIERFDVDPNRLVEHWRISPNPNMEHVYLQLSAFCEVYQVIIDTWSTEYAVGNEARSWGGVKALFR